MSEILQNLYYLIGIFGSCLFASWTVMLYQTRQNNQLKELIFQKHEQLKQFIIDKIEYHEKHDDMRFNQVDNSVWELRLRNAAIDGAARLKLTHEEHDGLSRIPGRQDPADR